MWMWAESLASAAAVAAGSSSLEGSYCQAADVATCQARSGATADQQLVPG